MNDFFARPPGAEEHEQALIESAAVHTPMERESRITDVLFNISHFEKEAKNRDEPLSLTVERGVKAPATGELPILLGCLNRLGISVKDVYGRQSTLTGDIKENKVAQKLLNAYSTEKSYHTMFGGIEQRKLQVASTRDAVPADTAANPSLQTPLKDRQRIAEYRFDIDDVYADVITTDLRNIDELIFENADTSMFEMYLRKELGDIKTTDIKISESENKMTQMAIALRWSAEFGENSVRMSAVDRWQMQVATRARNALRDMGLHKIANDGSPKAETVTGGKTRGNLFGIGFELGEAYPTNMLVMDVTTMKAWLAPSATTNIVTTIVDDMPMKNLLSFVAPNTDLGVTKDDKWLAASNNKILNYVRDLTLALYVKSTSFMTEISYNADNRSFKASISFDFTPVFIDRGGRIIWTIA